MEDIIDIIVTETTNLIEITSQPTDEIIDVNIIDNREDVTLNITPTVVEININSLTGNFGVNWGDIAGTLSNQIDLQNVLNLKADLVDGKVPSSQLPSYVDDVIEVATYSALPATGETGKIYVVLDTNLIYRWSGSAYIEIKDSSAVWGAITGTLSSQTDLQNALNAKEPTITTGTNLQYWRGDKSWQTLNTTVVAEGTNLYYTEARVNANTNVAANTAARHNAVTIGTANGLSLSSQVLSLGLASSSTNGALSSADWTTFNAKQAALSGTGFVKSTGGTISYDTNTYLTTSAAASTYLALAGGTLTGALFGASASFSGYVGFNGNTSPLYPVDVAGSGRFSGDLRIESTNPRIYLTDTDNNPDYFISNTDGTFTIYDVTNSASRLTISTSLIQPRLPIVSNSSIQGSAFYSDSFFSATTFVQATTFMDSPSYRLTGGTSPTGLYFGHTNKVVLANYTVGGGIDFETNGGNITMQLSSGGVLSTTGGASFGGALSGTSATFSGAGLFTAIANTYAGGALILKQFGGTNPIYLTSVGGYFAVSNGGSADHLLINSSGAATFSSTLRVEGSYLQVANASSPSVYINNTSVQWRTYLPSGSNNFAISDAVRDVLTLGYNGGNSYFNGCNVGIGTTSPGEKLHLAGASNNVFLNEATSGNYAINRLKNSTYTVDFGVDASGMYLDGSTGAFRYYNGSSELMRITSAGSVFIGKTTGSSKFGVSGLPTSATGLSSGDFYQVSGVVMVVP